MVKQMTPNPRTREQNQQATMSALGRKTRRLIRVYEEHLAVRYSERTAEGYLADVRAFLCWIVLRGIELAEVRTGDLEAYQAELASARKADGRLYSLSVQSHRITALKSLYGFLYRRGFVLTNPVATLEQPKTETRLPRVILTFREVKRILGAPDAKTPQGLRDRAMLETFYATGLRVSELIRLKVEDVDLEDGVLRIVLGKGRRDRVVPLTRAAAEAIEVYLAHARAALLGRFTRKELFLGGYGFALKRASVGVIVHRAAAKARIGKPVTCHTFRHTVATHLLRGGADIRQIQVLLGHRSLHTTETYTRVETSDLKKVLERAHPRGR